MKHIHCLLCLFNWDKKVIMMNTSHHITTDPGVGKTL